MGEWGGSVDIWLGIGLWTDLESMGWDEGKSGRK